MKQHLILVYALLTTKLNIWTGKLHVDSAILDANILAEPNIYTITEHAQGTNMQKNL